MRRRVINTLLATVVLLAVACGSSDEKKRAFTLSNATDSVSYIIGMNLADNIIALDSTLNIEVITRAIAERIAGNERFTDEQARNYFLKYHTYILPEQQRNIEEQYLADLARTQRRFTRTKSGLTYQIQEIGNEQHTPRYNNDLVKVRYSIYRLSGDTLYSSYIKGDTIISSLDDMAEGVKESLKMLGQGGKIEAVIPSKLLPYGEKGDSILGIKPYETLRYEIELVEMEKYGANKLQNRFNKSF